MGIDRIEQVLADFEALRDPDGEPELEAVEAALMLEDTCGVRLTDADIDPSVLGDATAIREFLKRTTGSD